MKIKFQAKYLGVLAQFAAKGDARYYLNGFHVEPAPEDVGGVYLKATNGHALVIIHDEQGSAEFSGILPITKDLVTKCKSKKGETRWISIEHKDHEQEQRGDGVCVVRLISLSSLLEESLVLAAEEKLIDGKYPNVARILPAYSKFEPIGILSVNPEYIARIEKSLIYLGARFRQVNIFGTGENGSYVGIPSIPEQNVVFVVMPMISDRKPEQRQWYSSFLREEEKLAAELEAQKKQEQKEREEKASEQAAGEQL